MTDFVFRFTNLSLYTVSGKNVVFRE